MRCRVRGERVSELRQDLFEVIEDVERGSTVDEVMDEIERFAGRFGFEFVILTGLSEEHFERAVLESRLPPEFLDLYVKNDYIKFDPVARLARVSAMPFCWDQEIFAAHEEDSRAHELKRYVSDFGIRNGFTIPIHRRQSGTAVVAFSGERADLTPHSKAALHLLGLYAFDRVSRLRPSTAPPTTREREVLTWVMQGKTAWEIGEILNIAKRTVDAHVTNACYKLRAMNRTHAVAVALRDGLIEP